MPRQSMESLNQTLFLLLNASAPSPAMHALMSFCANALIWAMPATLVAGWLRVPSRARPTHEGTSATATGRPQACRGHFVEAALAAALGMGIAQIIGAMWPHPRPFAIGLGHAWIAHVDDASLPSDHTTLAFSVACSLLLHTGTRVAGAALALAGLMVGWARIYAGIHFPLDVGCGMLLGMACAVLAHRLAPWVVPPLLRRSEPPYRFLCAALIRRGWAVA
ncbi:phosphatase PAP2 family protein [Mycetohabitans sp. B46]